MNIYLGADHRGFQLKEQIKHWLTSSGYQVSDLTPVFTPEDDYPAIGFEVAEHTVAQPDSLGVVCCGSGSGIAIAANKVVGARCGVGYSVEQVHASRHDDGLNILALASDYLDPELARKLVEIFLQTDVGQEERHHRRRDTISVRETKM